MDLGEEYYRNITSFLSPEVWVYDSSVSLLTFQVALLVKNPPASARDSRDSDSVPGMERSQGVGNGTPPQYSCLENSMGTGA